MTYEQNIDGCLRAQAGTKGLTKKAFEDWLSRTKTAIESLRNLHESRTLPLLRLPEDRADLEPCRQVAAYLQEDTSDLVVLGIGGSSLGGQALAQLVGHGTQGYVAPEGATRVHFLDNLDPDTQGTLLSNLDLSTTKFLAISKSGGTPEPLIQVLSTISALRDAGLGEQLGQHFAVIVSPGNNPLRRLADEMGCPILDHHPAVGGRFSVLSTVGLLPAMVLGLDVEAIREGAAEVLNSLLNETDPSAISPAVGAAVAVGLAEESDIGVNVLMPYSDRLARFSAWYGQLWAESLGKEGKGTVPIAALGPVDQHSQLQLYLAGPNDKFHTLIMLDQDGRGPRVAEGIVEDARLVYLSDKTIGDLVAAEQRATAETLIKNGRPTRIITVPSLDERSMGALLMHFMLETIIAADLLGVEPYDQPAVEEGKVLARRYLGEAS